MFRDTLRGQIEHPVQGIIVGETGLILRDQPELAVQAFDDVRRVYDLPFLFMTLFIVRPARVAASIQLISFTRQQATKCFSLTSSNTCGTKHFSEA